MYFIGIKNFNFSPYKNYMLSFKHAFKIFRKTK
jgi:hypothetical protein